MEVNSTGQTKDRYHSATVWTRPTVPRNGRARAFRTLTTEDYYVAVWGKSIGKPTGPTSQAWEGEMHFMTQSSKLAWVNTATFWIEESGDMSKEERIAR